MLAGCDERGNLEGLQQMRPFDECMISAGCPDGCGAAKDAHCWNASDWASDDAPEEQGARVGDTAAEYALAGMDALRLGKYPRGEGDCSACGLTLPAHVVGCPVVTVARPPLMVEAPTLLATVEAQLPKVSR
jgi:hypothetical protein